MEFWSTNWTFFDHLKNRLISIKRLDRLVCFAACLICPSVCIWSTPTTDKVKHIVFHSPVMFGCFVGTVVLRAVITNGHRRQHHQGNATVRALQAWCCFAKPLKQFVVFLECITRSHANGRWEDVKIKID